MDRSYRADPGLPPRPVEVVRRRECAASTPTMRQLLVYDVNIMVSTASKVSTAEAPPATLDPDLDLDPDPDLDLDLDCLMLMLMLTIRGNVGRRSFYL
jgi:hypothetical protein